MLKSFSYVLHFGIKVFNFFGLGEGVDELEQAKDQSY